MMLKIYAGFTMTVTASIGGGFIKVECSASIGAIFSMFPSVCSPFIIEIQNKC